MDPVLLLPKKKKKAIIEHAKYDDVRQTNFNSFLGEGNLEDGNPTCHF